MIDRTVCYFQQESHKSVKTPPEFSGGFASAAVFAVLPFGTGGFDLDW